MGTAHTEFYTLSLHDALPISCSWSPPPTSPTSVGRRRPTPRAPRRRRRRRRRPRLPRRLRSEEHTSELQSHVNLVCRLLLEKKNSDKMRCLLFHVSCVQNKNR